MSEVALIGIGAGNPDWITVEGVRALGELDVVFVVVKEGEYDDLVEARRLLLDRYARTGPQAPRVVELHDPARPWQSAPDYPAAVAAWRAQRRELWGEAIATSLGAGERGCFLVWGDPSLYESTLAIVQDAVAPLNPAPRVRVIPGVSSVLALAAAHRIPLNRQGRAVQITPARLVSDGLPQDVDDVVVMLDAHQAFTRIDPAGFDIYWAAYLGTPDEILVSGDLAQVRDEIASRRASALRAKGWVFDIYLLRRR